MPGPIEATGALRSPSRYGALGMGAREITGLWTHRCPLRDAAVPYLYSKFYSASRFDSMLDGINREISARMTATRAPGSSVFNPQVFPALNSFYSWSYIQDTQQIVRTIVDGSDGVVYDASNGQKVAICNKAAGAGPARFLSVQTQLYLGDGVEARKVLRSSKAWKANTSFNVGDYIIDANGNIQSIQANPQTLAITNVAVVDDPQFPEPAGSRYLVVTFSSRPAILSGRRCTFAGLTTYVALNGVTLTYMPLASRVVSQVLQLTSTQIAFEGVETAGLPLHASAPDTGTMVGGSGDAATTGAAAPAWANVWGAATADNGVLWTCFGPAAQSWGVTPIEPANAAYTNLLGDFLTLGPSGPGERVWQSGNVMAAGVTGYAIRDPLGNVQLLTPPASNVQLSLQPPQWQPTLGALTQDGGAQWINYGPMGSWFASNPYGGAAAGAANPWAVVDSNGNLQLAVTPTVEFTSGAAAPVWATATGALTADGTGQWMCCGPGSVLWSAEYEYGACFHAIDGSVSNIAPLKILPSGGLGPNGGFQTRLDINIAGTAADTDKQIDQLWIFRTAMGKTSPLFLDAIPNPKLLGATATYYVDVATDKHLTAEQIAPQAAANDPPPAQITGPVYFDQRIFAIVDNTVVWSGGPDTLVGNGNTAFPPLNFLAYPAQPIRLEPVTVQDGGILVFTTDGMWIILGDGTAGNPYYTRPYFKSVALAGPFAADVYNNAVYLMESNAKVSRVAIQFPFNPQDGYTEVGFPIGDQFKKVTTGGASTTLYNPATACLSWNNEGTDETAMYVADGGVGWFRMGFVAEPESGIVWSPRRAIVGGTSAVQSIETAPGKKNLLIGPPAGGGPILMRDATVATDNGQAYAAWDVRGAIKLCSTGQLADLAHIAVRSAPVGARPKVSMLLNEITASPERPWVALPLNSGISNEPPIIQKVLSMYSDRYEADQNGHSTLGYCLSVRFDYGTQNAADELLEWEVFAGLHEERKEEAEAAR